MHFIFGDGLAAESCPTLCDPWAVACQAPLSMGFPRQEYWSGSPFPSLGDLPHSEVEPRSTALQPDSLPTEPPGKPAFENVILRGNPWTSPDWQRYWGTNQVENCWSVWDIIRHASSFSPYPPLSSLYPVHVRFPLQTLGLSCSLLQEEEDLFMLLIWQKNLLRLVNRLFPNRKGSTSRLYIVTLLI